MFQKSFALLLLICGLQTMLAQIPFQGHCPEVKIMEQFNLDDYMGIWYEYSKYPFIFEIGKKCMYARYANIGNDTISVVNAAVNRITDHSSNITGTAKVIAPAQLAVKFTDNQRGDKPNYLVLGTDYTSYAIVYSCSNFTSLAHTKIVWILTRERYPTPETINAAKKILDDNGLLQTFLIQTIQDNCPEPISEEMEEMDKQKEEEEEIETDEKETVSQRKRATSVEEFVLSKLELRVE